MTTLLQPVVRVSFVPKCFDFRRNEGVGGTGYMG